MTFGVEHWLHCCLFFRPHITRNNSLILVDSKGNGKTMAYVPAICSLVQVCDATNSVIAIVFIIQIQLTISRELSRDRMLLISLLQQILLLS